MNKHTPYTFCSVFAQEMQDFISFRKNEGHNCRTERTLFKKLDKYLVEIDLSEKKLETEVIDVWLTSLPLAQGTKSTYIGTMRQFSRYLNGLGITAYYPTTMRIKRSFTPYVLSHIEIQRLFNVCDNIKIRKGTNASLWLPVMVRMLYGCGLRVGEMVALQNKDVDFKNGILTIRKAKGNKGRLVPMSNSLTEICVSYYNAFHKASDSETYFFHNNDGKPFSTLRPYMWLRKLYDLAGIDRHPDPTQSHGISVHTLRHTFAVHTLQQQSTAGIDRFYSIPILSTYLGHNDIYGTELYLQLTPEYHESIIKRAETYVGNIFPEVYE